MTRFAHILLAFSVVLATGPCLMADTGVHAVAAPMADMAMDCHEETPAAAPVSDCECCFETAVKPAKDDVKSTLAATVPAPMAAAHLRQSLAPAAPFETPPDRRPTLPVQRGDRLLA